MTKRIVILGAGTGGTLTANRLARHAEEAGLEITVIDKDDEHIYQPGLLFVPFGAAEPEHLIKSRREQVRRGVSYIQAGIDHVEVKDNKVVLEDGSEVEYDLLVVASGATIRPEETEGLLGSGWGKDVFTFYNLEGAVGLRKALGAMDHGRLVLNVIDMPIKCPVAPLEFTFLSDAFFEGRGLRKNIEIVYATPLDGAFTKPEASKHLSHMLGDRGIKLVTNFNTGEVDEENKKLISYDGQEVEYDLLVTIPLHGGAAYVANSPGLGDELDFIPTDPHSLQSKVADNIFVIGDAAGLPASKAGSVAHFEGEVLVPNILAYLAGQPFPESFDGHANCFIETGHHKALLIDFNYETQPLEGHFPGPFGLPLLKDSYLNHMGKLAFQQLYWHLLLPGHDIPMVGAHMPTAGKHNLNVQHVKTGDKAGK